MINRTDGKLPVESTHTDSAGNSVKCFFRNNPWKLSEGNDDQKIYRFCVICGNERFSSEAWSKVIDVWGDHPTICEKSSCYAALPFVREVVPQKRFEIITDLDKSRVKAAHKCEFFDIVIAI